ncbi:hypothetical protein SSABA_v1c02480 [Spiroplasma sabaudiense Ar-1343]|uniref:Riboflavin transporter n=1 Tax=Spiroplasma sabaudiense Ar-1343 TaxID=1276257 RepID=W6A9X2_9MOLU|nr:hypothetical protein [Spiroplasma sabaudiense]AHI53660.1 hypothetical protein SSABA_v1c02480 [Spiroplasma sabaudiense Ar-1343]
MNLDKNNENIVFKIRYQKTKWKEYFELTTLRITFLSLILALNITLAIFSRFIMGMIKIPPVDFMVLELTLVTYLVVLYFLNLFYTVIFVFIGTWVRLIIGDEPVGLLAMNIIDLATVLSFWILSFLLYKFLINTNLNRKQYLSRMYIIQGFSGLITAFITAAMGIFINWAFLLTLYGVPIESQNILLFPIGIFNFVKIGVNIIIYLSCFYAIDLLFNRYKI